ncbi:hypothetical protein WA1_05485 [Scytonema hofmannii PCC 7110]|uniref:Filamentous haemagglutinin FhaB/tRNA nuclease CdiA-like TPS domain-containing protein n=1 Tax=Scytonema hofmannii PCC 7110 TaxID=128403 RepID=A0A139WZW1_9CYAN|nr:filamentous hemagglutinin N-terminal domain-containing protein [Scytonema hofmannii]KYC37946.1 hypothetical protein WA1_05485 [Scytonema hofmannii PCC 7110]
MAQCSQRQNWKLLLVITLVFCGVSTNSRNCALAQLAPDTTLGAERSVVTPNILINNQLSDRIDSGAIRGANLFHSFSEFNVGNQRGVYFTNPVGIQNILSRVTGNNPSNIQGTLGVLGNANLFLINPNGIIFGQNASLDVNGSFVATTANGIQFGNLGTFSATNPEAPSSLLTINPSALFFNQINQTASIQNNSIADAGKDPAGIGTIGLRVPDGKSLLLVGGNVSMDGGELNAYGGRIELGGLAAPGNIALLSDGNNFRLTFPENVPRADISLTNGVGVYVEAAGGGSIAINSRNLEILDGSEIVGGIGPGLGTTGTQAGSITIDATGQIKLAGTNSVIANAVREEAVGNAGNITIKTGSLSVTDSTQISSFTRGQGNAGNITIQARDAVTFDGGLLSSGVDSSAVGNAGKIDITTGSLSLTNGAQIISLTRGQGNAGNITIQAKDAVTFDGFKFLNDKSSFFTVLLSNVEAGAVGNGGNIDITAGSLSLTNGGQLLAGVNGKTNTLPGGEGTAGNVKINVRDSFTISGTDSRISGRLDTGAVGRGGDINVQAGNVFVKDGGEIAAFTDGKGDAGNISIGSRNVISLDRSAVANLVLSREAIGNAGKIDITTGSLSLTNGAQVSSSTRGQGNAGSITIQAKNGVTFDGFQFFDNKSSISYTAILSEVDAGAVGNGGNINITAGSLSLTNGGTLQTGIREKSETLPGGRGIGGTVDINVRDTLTISGADSSILGSLGTGAIGRSGDIKVQAGNVFVKEGGQIISSTFGKGNAGNISITASNAISLNTSYIINNVQDRQAEGNAGKIDIITGSLTATNGAQINSFTRGQGNAGNITIQARNTVIFDGKDDDGLPSASFSDVQAGAVGNGGSINITASNLFLTNGGDLGVGVFGTSGNLPPGEGNGGIININVRDTLTVSGTDSIIRSGLGIETLGRSGDIEIESGKVEIIDGGIITSRSRGRGAAGKIDIKANSVRLNKGQIIAQTASSDGGNINLNLGQYLFLRNGSQISTTAGTAQAGGNGGNITINTPFLIAVPDENSDITANAFRGTGGNVNINARGIFGIEARPQPSNRTNDITASSDLGLSGTINVNSPDNSSIQNSLTELPTNAIDTNTLIANSCIVRSQKKQQGSFTITGTGGLPHRPGEMSGSSYSTGDVRNVTIENTSRLWKKGDPIIEPQGVYRLSNGQLVMSRECQ